MRINELLLEASALDLGKVTKYPERAQKFFDLIDQGHTFQTDTGPVQLDKSNIARLKPLLVKTNVGTGIRPTVLTTDGDTILMSKIHYDDAAFGGNGKSYASGAQLKPHPTFGHQNPEDPNATITPDLALRLGAFLSGQMNEKIQSNKFLDQQGETGKAVKDIANQIANSQVPTIPNLPANELGPILNDAFEYLGPMQLVFGTADFENSAAFFEHIGSDLKDLVVYFPGAVNHPVADSIALTNRKTDNTIYLSSKGGKSGKGAPSSVSALIMPEHMKKSVGQDPAVTFIDLLQQYKKGNKPAWRQPFDTANWIQSNYPGSLGPIEKFMPFDENLMKYLGNTWANKNKGVPNSPKQFPSQYRELATLVAGNTQGSEAELFYNIRYYVFLCIRNAINSGKAVPDFSKRMLEILGENYVSLATKAVGKPGIGKYVTTAKWPSKMGGRITLERKDGPAKWGASINWLLN
jgi:hypothetical protein